MYIFSIRCFIGVDGNLDLFLYIDGIDRGEYFYFCFINWVDVDVLNFYISIDI